MLSGDVCARKSMAPFKLISDCPRAGKHSKHTPASTLKSAEIFLNSLIEIPPTS
jgi:hypothetical protein